MRQKKQSKKSISYIKQKFLRTIMGGMGALMLLSAPNAFAFPTSGTCAMLVTAPLPYGATIPANGYTYNVLATITFTGATTGRIDFNHIDVLYTSSGPVLGDINVGSFPLTITDGIPILPGSKRVTFIDTVYNVTVSFNMYAVNGDRTILVQGANEPFSGVCQF